jgi:hypothetical protein
MTRCYTRDGAFTPSLKTQIKTSDGGYTIKFNGKPKIPLSSHTDAGIDRALKVAGLWKPGKPYPYFTIYNSDGDEVSGGGGLQSGIMGEPLR